MGVYYKPGESCWDLGGDERLRELWVAVPQLSCSEIASVLQKELKDLLGDKLLGPITKNGVVGRARRTWLDPRPSPFTKGDVPGHHYNRKKPHSRLSNHRQIPRPIGPTLAQFDPIVPMLVRVPLTVRKVRKPPKVVVKVRNEVVEGRPMRLSCDPCQWPLGHPHEKDFRLCGDSCLSGGFVYCPTHAKLAYSDVRGGIKGDIWQTLNHHQP